MRPYRRTDLASNFDQCVVRRPANRGFLKGPKPGPDRKAHGLHLIAPHVDVCALFEGKCEHGLAVIKKRRTNLEVGLLEENSPRGRETGTMPVAR